MQEYDRFGLDDRDEFGDHAFSIREWRVGANSFIDEQRVNPVISREVLLFSTVDRSGCDAVLLVTADRTELDMHVVLTHYEPLRYREHLAVVSHRAHDFKNGFRFAVLLTHSPADDPGQQEMMRHLDTFSGGNYEVVALPKLGIADIGKMQQDDRLYQLCLATRYQNNASQIKVWVGGTEFERVFRLRDEPTTRQKETYEEQSRVQRDRSWNYDEE